MGRRPRIAVITWWDSRRPASGARGTVYYMGRALERQYGDVVHIGPISTPGELWNRVRNRVARALGRRVQPFLHGEQLARAHAGIIRRRLPANLDAIYAPLGSTQIAYLETTVPIVYMTDGPFQLIRDYYPDFTDLNEEYAAAAHQMELRATARARILVYPSTWAAEGAKRFYQADPQRVHVVPYGASIELAPTAEEIARAKDTERCRLVFLGTDWERKGGPLAYQVVLELRRRGVDGVLSVCGCQPAGPYDPNALQVVGRIDKSTAQGRVAMRDLLLSANFMLQPARQEMFGIAYCEASAHGTPSIAIDTGGVRGAITDGENGFLLPPEAGPEAYADLIAGIFSDREGYLRLVRSSRGAYDTRLNWDAWGKTVGELIAQIA